MGSWSECGEDEYESVVGVVRRGLWVVVGAVVGACEQLVGEATGDCE